jgi:hypothetical protein
MPTSEYVDDFVVGSEHRGDAKQFLHDLRERFAKFNLELHPEKTRLIEFGRYAAQNRSERGLAKPESSTFSASRTSAERGETGASGSSASPRRSGCGRS